MVSNSDILQNSAESLRDRIPLRLLRYSFAKSSGPGGQNVNKVATRVTLMFDLGECEDLTCAQKRRIRAKLGGRISKDGVLRVVSMRHRSQRANRTAVTERFYELIAGALQRPKLRKPTRPTRASRERRMVRKRLVGQRKKERRERPSGE